MQSRVFRHLVCKISAQTLVSNYDKISKNGCTQIHVLLLLIITSSSGYGGILEFYFKQQFSAFWSIDGKTCIEIMLILLQYRSASLSINTASRAGACTDCEYIECTIYSDHNYYYISTIIIFSGYNVFFWL